MIYLSPTGYNQNSGLKNYKYKPRAIFHLEGGQGPSKKLDQVKLKTIKFILY